MSPIVALPLILVVTATTGFRHESIPVAESVIAQIAARTRSFQVQFVRSPEEMPTALSSESLQRVRVVMFVNTSGELPALAELLNWVREGGSFVGVHSASDTWHSSPEYIAMLGGEFLSHPEPEMASIVVESFHLSTAWLESPHALFEEIYTFTNFHPDAVQLLLRHEDGRPLAWHKSFGRGRVLYTALGHREEVWMSDWFQRHLTGSIAWALQQGRTAPRRRAVRP